MEVNTYSTGMLRDGIYTDGTFYSLGFTLEFRNTEDQYRIAYSYPYTYKDYQRHIVSLLEFPDVSAIRLLFKTLQARCGALTQDPAF
jgi:hypothetical protein